MISQPTVISNPTEVAAKLAELGLSAKDLRESIWDGLTEASRCTKNDPVILPSLTVWGKATGSLRDHLKSKDWVPDRDRGYETVLNVHKRLAIAVAGGDAATGNDNIPPATRTDKGPATIRAIRANNPQRVVEMSELDTSFPKPEPPLDYETRLLLYYVDRDATEVRMELSLPLGMEGGHVTVWGPRIILAPWSTTDPNILGNAVVAKAIPVNVPVIPKSN